VGLTGSTNPLAPGGTGAAGDIKVTPSPLKFGGVVVGTSDSQTMTLSNTGKADLTITRLAISGSGFSASGIPTPFTLGAGLTENFTASFKPATAGALSGHISIESSSANLSVSLSGTGVASAPQISPSTSKVNFGNTTVGTSSSQSIVLKNTGNANLDISKVSASGTGFTASGGSDVTLTPDQSVTVTVSFDPKAAGSVSGGLTVTSNATNAAAVELSGAGVAVPAAPAAPPSVALKWDPSASAVIGYFVYRGAISGGPYAKLFTAADANPSYTDASVAAGQTYYYVVTSVDSRGVESTYSNQVSVAIPAS
jgi:Abnormal spindle-like microcephaly-assoc'd, ASPM-SPD-2-Hydin